MTVDGQVVGPPPTTPEAALVAAVGQSPIGYVPPTPTAVLQFGASGQLISVSAFGVNGTSVAPINLTAAVPVINAAGAAVGTGSVDFSFSFAPAGTATTQFASAFGATATQDGNATGNLNNFTFGADGTIQGQYSNGKTQALGQVLLANFTNPQGLQPIGNNQWISSVSSGAPMPGNVPGTNGFGSLQASAVEESNVDLTAELVNMITAQRNYQANAQTIKTQDQLLQTIVNLK